MSDYAPGDIVDITIKGARVIEVCRHGDGNGDDLRFTYEAKDGDQWPNSVWAQAPGVTVERGDPEWWPLRPGDLLRYEGKRWFAISYGSNVVLKSGHAEHMDAEEAWQRRHELTLVHREDERDGGAR